MAKKAEGRRHGQLNWWWGKEWGWGNGTVGCCSKSSITRQIKIQSAWRRAKIKQEKADTKTNKTARQERTTVVRVGNGMVWYRMVWYGLEYGVWSMEYVV